MLLILMYHRVHNRGRVPNALRTHLAYLRDHHPLVLPGDLLPARELSVCLTFDDATVDFYQAVYPLLCDLNARVLLAVPTGLIETDTLVPLSRRLQAQEQQALGECATVADSPLCTWKELRQMQASGHIRCAAHGHRHVSMTAINTAVVTELRASHASLIQHVGQTPDTFVYPFGHMNRNIHHQTRRYYPYALRIGGAWNRDWNGNAGLLYRVNAEPFWLDGKHWSQREQLRYRFKRLVNLIRQK